MIDKFHFLYFA